MSNVFISVLNMSLAGAFVIVTLCFIRVVLKNIPKIFLYCLWLVAGLRLVFPFSIESLFSLTLFHMEPIPVNIVSSAISDVGGVATVAPLYGGNPFGLWLTIGSIIWLCGVVFMLSYGAVSIAMLKRRLRGACNIESNIYEIESLKTPFVMGVFSPKIYLPAFLSPEERKYIILHEQAHIARNDHIVKFAAYLVLSLHWFNPLVWLALRLLNMDMEMSCDERVLKSLGGGIEFKKDYSSALVSLACEQRFIGGNSLAFSAGHVSSRVRNVLNTKKQSYIAFGLSIALVLALSAGFSVNLFGVEAANHYAEAEPAKANVTTNYYAQPEQTQIDLAENKEAAIESLQTVSPENNETETEPIQVISPKNNETSAEPVRSLRPAPPPRLADDYARAEVFLNYISNFGLSCSIAASNYLSAEAIQS